MSNTSGKREGDAPTKYPESKRHYRGKQPSGYVFWMEWAEKMSKTHVQLKCPGCGLYKIWKPIGEGRV